MAAKRTVFQRISDDAVRAKTARGWEDWFSILDKFGLKEKGHTRAAKYLQDKHGLSAWWAQAVTIRYEWERGLRGKESSRWPLSSGQTLYPPSILTSAVGDCDLSRMLEPP